MKRQVTVNELISWVEEIDAMMASKSILYEVNRAKFDNFKNLNGTQINRCYKDILKVAPKYYEHTVNENGKIIYKTVEGKPVLKEGAVEADFEKERMEVLETVVNIYL